MGIRVLLGCGAGQDLAVGPDDFPQLGRQPVQGAPLPASQQKLERAQDARGQDHTPGLEALFRLGSDSGHFLKGDTVTALS